MNRSIIIGKLSSLLEKFALPRYTFLFFQRAMLFRSVIDKLVPWYSVVNKSRNTRHSENGSQPPKVPPTQDKWPEEFMSNEYFTSTTRRYNVPSIVITLLFSVTQRRYYLRYEICVCLSELGSVKIVLIMSQKCITVLYSAVHHRDSDLALICFGVQ